MGALGRVRILTWGFCAFGTALVMASSSVAEAQQAQDTSPKTVQEWLMREHRFLRCYLAVVQQATHDYMYDYKTPALLIPVTIDLFTGYVARPSMRWSKACSTRPCGRI